jgi:phosphate transport system protein
MRPGFMEFDDLQNKLLEMGGLVEGSIHNSIRSLVEGNSAFATEVLESEARINEIDIEVDELATRLLALHQPVARDLRLVTAGLKINSNLERMGDLATNIARRSVEYLERPSAGGLVDIPRMARMVEVMVRKSLDAIVNRDEATARSVLLSDDEVDDLKEAVYAELLAMLEARTAPPASAFDLIFIAHNLERIADHATNIAECALFLVTGLDVRHHHTA